jgi:hypothetical protein
MSDNENDKEYLAQPSNAWNGREHVKNVAKCLKEEGIRLEERKMFTINDNHNDEPLVFVTYYDDRISIYFSGIDNCLSEADIDQDLIVPVKDINVKKLSTALSNWLRFCRCKQSKKYESRIWSYLIKKK